MTHDWRSDDSSEEEFQRGFEKFLKGQRGNEVRKAMSPEQLALTLSLLGLSNQAAGRFLGHWSGRQVRRWLSGEVDVPLPVAHLLRLMVAKNVMPTEVTLLSVAP